MLRAPQAVNQQQDEEFLDHGEHDERDHRTEAEAEAGPVDETEEDETSAESADDEPDDGSGDVLTVREPAREGQRRDEHCQSADEREERRDVSEEAPQRRAVLLPAPGGLSLVAGGEAERVDDRREQGVQHEHDTEDDQRRSVEDGADHGYFSFSPWDIVRVCAFYNVLSQLHPQGFGSSASIRISELARCFRQRNTYQFPVIYSKSVHV